MNIYGNESGNILYGGSSTDYIYGNGGSDRVFGGSGDDLLDGGTSNDLLDGGYGNDLLYGGSGNDLMIGGQGADRIYGGSGVDTASYASSAVRISIDLQAGTASGGDAQGDVLSSIEDLIGGSAKDQLLGDGNANRFQGQAGDDVMHGRGGADWLYGGTGSDVFYGGSGGDMLDGGDGIDTAAYTNASGAVWLNLGTGQGLGGEAAGDRYVSIENVIGSAYNDIIQGSSAHNNIVGYDGNDTIVGGVGGDRMWGGLGADKFVYATWTESTSVLAGNDLYVDHIGDFDRAQGDKIDLSAIDANYGVAGNQAFQFKGYNYNPGVGQLTYHQEGSNTVIEAEASAYGAVTDIRIVLEGLHRLTADDFVL